MYTMSVGQKWSAAVATGLLYLFLAKVGLAIHAASGFATLVWPPTGVAIAAMVLFGPGVWPAIAASALVVNVWTGAPFLAAGGIACGNTLEAIAAAFVLRAVGFDRSLWRIR